LPRSGDGSNTDGRSGGVGKPTPVGSSWPKRFNAYCEAQRRATRARLQGDAGEFYHWAKIAAEVGRIAPQAKMNIDVVRVVVTEEERRGT
jgi:hypothetical protein